MCPGGEQEPRYSCGSCECPCLGFQTANRFGPSFLLIVSVYCPWHSLAPSYRFHRIRNVPKRLPEFHCALSSSSYRLSPGVPSASKTRLNETHQLNSWAGATSRFFWAATGSQKWGRSSPTRALPASKLIGSQRATFTLLITSVHPQGERNGERGRDLCLSRTVHFPFPEDRTVVDHLSPGRCQRKRFVLA